METLSCGMLIGPKWRDIFPTGEVFTHRVSVMMIQKIYIAVNIRSFVSCVVASCDFRKNENIKYIKNKNKFQTIFGRKNYIIVLNILKSI